MTWSPREGEGKHRVQLEVKQVQPGPAFRLRVPVRITCEAEGASRTEVVALDGREVKVECDVAAPVRAVTVDPDRTLRLLRARVEAAAGK